MWQLTTSFIFLELLTHFFRIYDTNAGQSELDQFLSNTGIELKPFSKQSLALASAGWMQYRTQYTKRNVQCPKCGTMNIFTCSRCNKEVLWRNHLITDFLIGGHATDLGERLLSRDRGYYRNYFPDLEVVY